jgi:DNA-binding response OmpR family regulator
MPKSDGDGRPDLRVLVVGEHKLRAGEISKLCAAEGWFVAAAWTGGQALLDLHRAAEAGSPFHAVLVYYDLSDRSSFDLLAAIRREASLESPVLVLVMRQGGAQSHALASALGIRVLQAPATAEAVRAAVARDGDPRDGRAGPS